MARPLSLKLTVMGNLLARAWSAVVMFSVVPIYVRLLGIESYGLIGFYATIQALAVLLDLGLSTTLTRELARAHDPARRRDLLRTLEYVYIGIALVIALVGISLSRLIAERWVHSTIPSETVAEAIALMVVALSCQWPLALYAGAFRGLERQVKGNVLNAVLVTVRGGGAIGVLLLLERSLRAFFIWTATTNISFAILSGILVWRSMPPGARGRFDAEILRTVRTFAAGVSSISLVAVVLTQLDKLVLSRVLPLDQFGYYALAAVAASGLYTVISPLFETVFPRFSSLVRTEDPALPSLYHRASQAMSLMLLPVTVVLVAFSRDVLLAWTGSPETVRYAGLPLALLALGTFLNGSMNIPYALQLAHGWTRLSFLTNVIGLLVMIPALTLLARRFGTVGAASCWVGLNATYVFVQAPLMYRRLLRHEMRSWYLRDLGLPALIAFSTGGALSALLATGASRGAALINVGLCLGVVTAVLAITPPGLDFLRETWRTLLPGKAKAF